VRLAIVGAGFVGLEVAATARALGVDVTLIEAAPVPLAGVLGPALGGWFAQLHRTEGVRLLAGAGVSFALPGVAGAAVSAVQPAGAAVSAALPAVARVSAAVAGAPVRELVLADGRVVVVDVVLSAVGVVPDTRWLAGSPLAGDRVAVDGSGRTAVPGVWGAGDVIGGQHWEPAARSGAAAARSILGLPAAAAPPASFWSDQYGIRIQLVGSAAGADDVSFDGSVEERSFTAVLRRRGALAGALLVGRPHELPTWRRRLAEALEPERNAA
jgi:NADPH-dependent 2,4-dienoyl-CoA reductase/sulfur reductase-like enzyme